jgi:O-antigen ligase
VNRFYGSTSLAGAASNSGFRELATHIERVIINVFSFETAFVLFIFAGVYKSDPRLAWFPVDLTLLFFVVSIMAGAWVLFCRNFVVTRRALLVSLGIFVFLSWMAISLAWSPSRIYGVDKAQQLLTLTMWAGLAPALVIAPEPARFRRFVWAALAFASTLALDGFINYVMGKGAVFSSANYLNMGRTAGIGIVIASVLFASARTWTARAAFAGILAVLFFVLWIDGGRGPFLAAVGGVLVLGLASFRRMGSRLRVRMASSVAALFLVSAAVAAGLGSESRTLYRLSVLVTQEAGGASAGNRLRYYDLSAEPLSKSPLFGVGLGGWPVVVGLGDVQRYPHNIFMETTTEGGLVGLLLLLTAIGLGVGALPLSQAFDEREKLIVTLIFLVTFSNALTSWDLSENRVVFTALGLMAIAQPRRPDRLG